MTQYYSVNSNLPKPTFMKKQQHDNMSSQSNLRSDLPPLQPNPDSRRDANRTAADINKDKHKVYNCASKTLLVGPSIINASPPKNNISLPSLNHFIHNQKDSRIRPRDHPSNNNPWFNIPPPPIHRSLSFSSSTPVTQHRYMVSNSPQQQQQFTSSDPFVKHDSGTTSTGTKRRPLKRQRAITPPIAYILPKKKGNKEKQQCHSCQSTETPEWRKGPLGPRTLCNACGLIWTKLCKQQEEGDKSRRKFKNNHSASPSTSITTMTSPVTMEDCNTSGYCSSSCSSSGDRSPSPTLKKDSNDSKKKLTLSYLLS